MEDHDPNDDQRSNDTGRGGAIVLLLACATGGIAVWVLLFLWLF